LLTDQLVASTADADCPSNTAAIAEVLDQTPFLQEAVSASKAKYKQTLEKKRQAEEIHQPQPEKDKEERGDKIRKIAQDAAAKLRAEADEKQRKASEKQQELVRLAAIEYLRQEFGSKGKRQKTCPDSIKEKLQKACRCHLAMPPGAHKEKCNLLLKICAKSCATMTPTAATSKHSCVHVRP